MACLSVTRIPDPYCDSECTPTYSVLHILPKIQTSIASTALADIYGFSCTGGTPYTHQESGYLVGGTCKIGVDIDGSTYTYAVGYSYSQTPGEYACGGTATYSRTISEVVYDQVSDINLRWPYQYVTLDVEGNSYSKIIGATAACLYGDASDVSGGTFTYVYFSGYTYADTRGWLCDNPCIALDGSNLCGSTLCKAYLGVATIPNTYFNPFNTPLTGITDGAPGNPGGDRAIIVEMDGAMYGVCDTERTPYYYKEYSYLGHKTRYLFSGETISIVVPKNASDKDIQRIVTAEAEGSCYQTTINTLSWVDGGTKVSYKVGETSTIHLLGYTQISLGAINQTLPAMAKTGVYYSSDCKNLIYVVQDTDEHGETIYHTPNANVVVIPYEEGFAFRQCAIDGLYWHLVEATQSSSAEVIKTFTVSKNNDDLLCIYSTDRCKVRDQAIIKIAPTTAHYSVWNYQNNSCSVQVSETFFEAISVSEEGRTYYIESSYSHRYDQVYTNPPEVRGSGPHCGQYPADKCPSCAFVAWDGHWESEYIVEEWGDEYWLDYWVSDPYAGHGYFDVYSMYNNVYTVSSSDGTTDPFYYTLHAASDKVGFAPVDQIGGDFDAYCGIELVGGTSYRRITMADVGNGQAWLEITGATCPTLINVTPGTASVWRDPLNDLTLS